MTTINFLIDLNKKSIQSKIDTLKIIDDCYPANDLICILSDSIERDKRLINEYLDSEVVLKKVKKDSYSKWIRYFTKSGLIRYLHEGKIFSYINACEIFNVKPINKKHIEWDTFLNKCINSDGEYNVSSVLKWLFEKRKSCKSLGTYCALTDIVNFASNFDIDEDKLSYLITKSNT